MSLDFNIDPNEDFWGYDVDDLQSDMSVSGNNILGNLKFIEDYSSAFPEGLDSGNYMALHFDTEVSGATITVTLDNPSVLDEDGLIVVRVRDKSSQTLRVVASKEGYDTTVKEYSLRNLICAES